MENSIQITLECEKADQYLDLLTKYKTLGGVEKYISDLEHERDSLVKTNDGVEKEKCNLDMKVSNLERELLESVDEKVKKLFHRFYKLESTINIIKQITNKDTVNHNFEVFDPKAEDITSLLETAISLLKTKFNLEIKDQFMDFEFDEEYVEIVRGMK